MFRIIILISALCWSSLSAYETTCIRTYKLDIGTNKMSEFDKSVQTKIPLKLDVSTKDVYMISGNEKVRFKYTRVKKSGDIIYTSYAPSSNLIKVKKMKRTWLLNMRTIDFPNGISIVIECQ